MKLRTMTEADVADFAQLPTHVPSMDVIIHEHLILDDEGDHAEFYVASYDPATREMFGFEIPGTECIPGEWTYTPVKGWIPRRDTIKRDLDWKPVRAYEVEAIREIYREYGHWPRS